ISANITDPDGTIVLVEFLNGTQVLGTTDRAPYSFTWNNVSVGQHTFTVRATDSKGGVTTSSPVTFTVEIVTGLNKYYGADATMNIYPNPSQNEIQIESESDLADAIIKFFDSQGTEVNVPVVLTGSA